MGVDVTSDTEIYKNTYHELVLWIKELLEMRRSDETVYDRNLKQAARIMELEFDLRKFSRIMGEDKEETVVKEYGTADDNVISNEEFIRYRKSKGGGNGGTDDWLTDMEWGTIFYVRQKPVITGSRSWLLTKFLMAGTRKNVVLLVPMAGAEEVVTDDREWLPVEPKAFCKNWDLVAEMPPIPRELDE